MSKTWKILIPIIATVLAVVAVVAVGGIAVGATYNGFVVKEQEVKGAYSEISNQLQRRADLIPNFVETVKGYSDYEQETLTAVINARNALNSAEGAEEESAASQKLDSAIDIWVNAVTEAYPDIKANEQYIALQDELAGTENRIAKARYDYNNKVEEYNKSVKRFPGNLVASIFGFEEAEFFKHNPAADNVPQVGFA